MNETPFLSFFVPFLKRSLVLNSHSNTNLAKAATLKLQNGKWIKQQKRD